MFHYCIIIIFSLLCILFTSIHISDSQQCSRQWSCVDDRWSSSGSGLYMSLLSMPLCCYLERKVSLIIEFVINIPCEYRRIGMLCEVKFMRFPS